MVTTPTEISNHIYVYKNADHYDGISRKNTTGHKCQRIGKNQNVKMSNNPRVSSPSGSYPGITNDLSILSMNIAGLTNWKLSDEVLSGYFKSFDIILLQETWAAMEDDFNIAGYEYFNFPR